MKYCSTRGSAPHLGFDDVLLTGLANDGGLYIPNEWPYFSDSEIRKMKGLSYGELATKIIYPFIQGSIIQNNLQEIIIETYKSFNHSKVAPIRQLKENIWIMELYHGPTLSFKDYALQVIGSIFENILSKNNRNINIVGATSGDTGSAAISSCANRSGMNIFILHPEGRISEVQRRQMTTVNSPNVFNIAIKGTFDDCQSLVKLMFKDEIFREKLNLSAVNSINWARILFQIVYYFYAVLSIGALNKSVSFSVPTGNFGNVFAGYCSKKIGLPISKFYIGSNNNDILTRFFSNRSMIIKDVVPTISPAMDIQVSSNFERLLYDVYKGDHLKINNLMRDFSEKKCFTVDPEIFKKIKSNFEAYKLDDEETKSIMKKTFDESQYILDPHTAVGLGAIDNFSNILDDPLVVLSTAHPSKFPDAVKSAIGRNPSLPDSIKDLYNLKEDYNVLPNNLDLVKDYIYSNASL